MKLCSLLAFSLCWIVISSARLSEFETAKSEETVEDISEDLRDYTEDFDWRHHGAISPVKDEAACSACYAFAAVDCIESHHFIRIRKLILLSKQQVIDCSKEYGNNGCHSGNLASTFNYVKTAGLMNEEHYPYKGRENSRCLYVKNSAVVTIEGYHRVAAHEFTIMQEVKNGPVAVMVNVMPSLRKYTHGIYQDNECRSSHEKHALLIIGYGRENGLDYWIIKNNWVKYKFYSCLKLIMRS